jgi:tRNA-splicing ligase RtcB (3'-phosphate/5'-hydroxy nucleic acid ligase)
MEPGRFRRVTDHEWWIDPVDGMRVPGIIYATEDLIRGMDDKVYDQVANVAKLPGIVGASYAMPDAHWGYGFPIGGVAAFDADEGGVVSAGGVGFDISCGVRDIRTGLTMEDIEPVKRQLADELFRVVPAGVGSRGAIHLSDFQMEAMLEGGAAWAVHQGWGRKEDLERIEEYGQMEGADPEAVSAQAKRRQRDEMGTLGSGNHYLEVQRVERVYDTGAARALGLEVDGVVVSIHCGSRGLGHQIGTEFLQRMVQASASFGIELPDRELACAPIHSDLGREYLGAMRAGINCALANREIITHLARGAFATVIPKADLELIYDVSHNTCKLEEHRINGRSRQLFVHRKGATRAFPAGHPELPEALRGVGQPVLIGGTMGTASWVLMGAPGAMGEAFGSACHGAGRAMSRHQATKHWKGRQLVDELAAQGILIRCHSSRGVAEEAPGAYKDVDAVVHAAEEAGLARRVARLTPVICVKG